LYLLVIGLYNFYTACLTANKELSVVRQKVGTESCISAKTLRILEILILL